MKPGDAVPFDQAGYVESVQIAGPDPIRVVVSTKRAFGDPVLETEIEWPPEWRLPQSGELIHLTKESAGFVEWVGFDLDRRVVMIRLR